MSGPPVNLGPIKIKTNVCGLSTYVCVHFAFLYFFIRFTPCPFMIVIVVTFAMKRNWNISLTILYYTRLNNNMSIWIYIGIGCDKIVLTSPKRLYLQSCYAILLFNPSLSSIHLAECIKPTSFTLIFFLQHLQMSAYTETKANNIMYKHMI